MPGQRPGLLNYRSGAALPRSVGSRQNGLPGGGGVNSTALTKMASGQAKGSVVAKHTARSSAPGRTGTTKVKTEGSRAGPAQAGASKTVNVATRKGVFVPGTSARMNICQVGGSVPSLPKASQSGAQAKVDALRKSVSGKMILSSVELKSGKIAGQSSRVATAAGPVLKSENLNSNGVVKERSMGKKGSGGVESCGASIVGNLNTSKGKSSQETKSAMQVSGAAESGSEKVERPVKTGKAMESSRRNGEGNKGGKKDPV